MSGRGGLHVRGLRRGKYASPAAAFNSDGLASGGIAGSSMSSGASKAATQQQRYFPDNGGSSIGNTGGGGSVAGLGGVVMSRSVRHAAETQAALEREDRRLQRSLNNSTMIDGPSPSSSASTSDSHKNVPAAASQPPQHSTGMDPRRMASSSSSMAPTSTNAAMRETAACG